MLRCMIVSARKDGQPKARNRNRMVVVRRAADFPAPTPQSTSCRLWQGSVNTGGYGRVTHRGRIGAHRWVVQTAGEDQFGTPWDPALEVMHLCDNPPCYRYEHLRLGTHAMNVQDCHAKSRHHVPSGERGVDNSKLTVETVREIRRLGGQGVTQLALAEMFGVSRRCIICIVNRKTWLWVET